MQQQHEHDFDARMRQCKVCGEMKSLNEFYNKVSGRGSLCRLYTCIDCYKDVVVTRAKKNEHLIIEARTGSCTDCAAVHPWYIQELDHRDPRQKEFGLGLKMASHKNTDRLIAEIAKCDRVCPTCHRYRTYKQHQDPELKEYWAQKHREAQRKRRKHT